MTEYDETMDKLCHCSITISPRASRRLYSAACLRPLGATQPISELNLVPLAITRARPYGSAVTPTGCASAGKSLVAAADLVESDDDRE